MKKKPNKHSQQTEPNRTGNYSVILDFVIDCAQAPALRQMNELLLRTAKCTKCLWKEEKPVEDDITKDISDLSDSLVVLASTFCDDVEFFSLLPLFIEFVSEQCVSLCAYVHANIVDT